MTLVIVLSCLAFSNAANAQGISTPGTATAISSKGVRERELTRYTWERPYCQS